MEDKSGAVPRRDTVLYGRQNRREAEAVELEVAGERGVGPGDIKIRMQIAPEPRQNRLYRRTAASDHGVALQDADLEPGATQICTQRKTVVTGAHDHAVEFGHVLTPEGIRLFAR